MAPSSASPDRLQESDGAILGIRAVVFTHNGLDCLGSLVGVVEGNSGDKMVCNVSLNDAVQELAANEAKLSIDSGSRSTSEVPGFRVVVGE